MDCWGWLKRRLSAAYKRAPGLAQLSSGQPAFMANRLTRWLLAQRSSPRLAFLLQIGCRVLNSFCSLLWIRLLLQSMGPALNGLLLNFQSITSLGGLGDLGMGGLVNIQTSRILGQGKEEELRKFLAAARAFFGMMALVAGCIFLVIAPGLFRWQKFAAVPGVGPLAGLCVLGALAIALLILNSYIANLNYGCGNVVWPVVPVFLITQLGFFAHWLLARKGVWLWMQYLPYLTGAMLIFLLGWVWIRISHPSLGTVRPLTVDRKQFVELAGKSFWVYLYGLAGVISATISALLITARFGPEMLVTFRYNTKLSELAYFVVNSRLPGQPAQDHAVAGLAGGSHPRAGGAGGGAVEQVSNAHGLLRGGGLSDHQ